MGIFDASGRGTPVPKDMTDWGRLLRTQAPQGAIPRAAQVPPFWQLKPPGGVDLNGTGRGALAAVVGATVALPLVPAFQVIGGYRGVLSSLILTVLAPLATLDITFRLRDRGGFIQGWTWTPQQVAANAIIFEIAGPLQIVENANLDVLVTNNAATGPWNVEANALGWMWPRVLEQQTFGTSE